jgi:hypothetical protein
MTTLFRRRVYGSIVLLLVVTATAAAGLADRRQITELLLRAGKGDVAAVTVMLAGGIPVDSHQPEARETALMAAASAGHVQLVHFLLTAGAAVNARDVGRETALLRATMKGHVDIWHDTPEQRALIRRLLAAGADVDAGSRRSERAPVGPAIPASTGPLLALAYEADGRNSSTRTA